MGKRGDPPLWAWAALTPVLGMAMTGCSALKVEGGCTYERTIKTSYVCEPGGSLEHYRVAPGGPEP